MSLTKKELAKYLDHTILAPDATIDDIQRVTQEGIDLETKSVVVNPYWVNEVSKMLEGTDVLTTTVIGFPLGANSTDVKVFETKKAIEDGADEIDMVINIGELKKGNNVAVLNDIRRVADETHKAGKLLKVIIETSLLNNQEIETASRLTKEAGSDYVKTSTGFSTGGATVEDVSLMRRTVGDNVGVKASGGVHNLDEALAMIDAGASRIGTSSSLEILKDLD